MTLPSRLCLSLTLTSTISAVSTHTLLRVLVTPRGFHRNEGFNHLRGAGESGEGSCDMGWAFQRFHLFGRSEQVVMGQPGRSLSILHSRVVER